MMELLGQVVIINASKEEATITQVTNQKIDEINISLDNGKTYRLKLVIINNIIHFKDDQVQKAVLDAINNHNIEQDKKEEIRKEATRVAIQNNIQKSIKAEEKRKNSSKEKVRKDEKNAAYKATYCDGNGQWFTAPCSAQCRHRNCSKYGGGVFCSTESTCKEVEDGKKDESAINEAFNNTFLCYESRILLDYKIYAGRDGSGKLRGWRLDKDRLVVLTTIKPGREEKDRVIFGAFLVEHSYEKTLEEEASVTSYPDCRLALTPEEAEQMKYWEYKPGERGKNPIQWKEGLTRFISDSVCTTILKDLVKIIEKRNDPLQTASAKAFLNKFLGILHMKEEEIPEKMGALAKKE